MHPNILRTCKTIFEEASSILIQRNHFVYHSMKNSLHLKMLRTRWDRSWEIMLNRYHCNPPHSFPSGLGGSSHRIRHLDIRLADFADLRTVYATLPHFLYAQNTLKTLNLELWAPWKRHYLLGRVTRTPHSFTNTPSLCLHIHHQFVYIYTHFSRVSLIIAGVACSIAKISVRLRPIGRCLALRFFIINAVFFGLLL